MFRILRCSLASMAHLVVRSGRSKEPVIIVLRHQLAVPGQRPARSVITDDDQSLLGAITQALPRRQRTGWLKTPDTLSRWYRRRVTRPDRTDHQNSHPLLARCAYL